MSEPGEGQDGSRRPAAGPAVSGPSPLPSLARRVPTGRPLPHSALPSPAPPSLAPAQRQADLPKKAPVTAIGRPPARYLVRHSDGGFPRGLRTAAASGTQNLAPGFTNPSLFPTAQHRGWRDFRYCLRHFRYALGAGIGKSSEAGKRVGATPTRGARELLDWWSRERMNNLLVCSIEAQAPQSRDQGKSSRSPVSMFGTVLTAQTPPSPTPCAFLKAEPRNFYCLLALLVNLPKEIGLNTSASIFD